MASRGRATPKAVDLALPQWNDAPSPVMPMPGVPMQIEGRRGRCLRRSPQATWHVRCDGPGHRRTGGGDQHHIDRRPWPAAAGLVVAMPDAAELRLYRKDRLRPFETTGKAINEAIARNRRADGDAGRLAIWWTPTWKRR